MMYRKVVNVAMVSFGIFNLIGCTHLNSNFDCPMKPGINCESIDQINARVDCGQFNDCYKVVSHCTG